ncbi:MAG: hypothetical protein H6834_08140 [Planctomycetes bacterium]|nr:hypothetical protein [Planctomycetota bacterium]
MLALLLLASSWHVVQDPPKTEEIVFQDRVAQGIAKMDPTAPERVIVDAFATYDVKAIRAAVAALEGRLAKPPETVNDGYYAALGYLELLVIEKFYRKEDPKAYPESLKGFDVDQASERGRELAAKVLELSPRHGEAMRLLGEFHAHLIAGMMSGMTEGPRAREWIDKARETDNANGWAIFGEGRMLFHNPGFAGGDKPRAQAIFKRLAKEMPHVRVSLYLARSYEHDGMLVKASYWTRKALSQAPTNPEARWLQARIDQAIERETKR